MGPLHEIVRTLVRDRGIAVLTVALLASTMGATSGVFAVLNAVVLRPLPIAD
jgi:hypothetical protein